MCQLDSKPAPAPEPVVPQVKRPRGEGNIFYLDGELYVIQMNKISHWHSRSRKPRARSPTGGAEPEVNVDNIPVQHIGNQHDMLLYGFLTRSK